MHVLRRVLEHAVASVVVLDVVQRHGLEAAPAQGHDEGVPVLQDAVVPPVFLQPHLNTPHSQLHTHAFQLAIFIQMYTTDCQTDLTN